MGPAAMMTCREVSTLVSSRRLADAPMTSRLGARRCGRGGRPGGAGGGFVDGRMASGLGARVNLMLWRRCRAWGGELEGIAWAASAAGDLFPRAPAEDFELRILSSYLVR